MALYIGNQKVRLNFDGSYYIMRLYTPLNGVRLLSSDRHILKDINGTYLFAKKNMITLLSVDDFVLQDADGLNLIIEEDGD